MCRRPFAATLGHRRGQRGQGRGHGRVPVGRPAGPPGRHPRPDDRRCTTRSSGWSGRSASWRTPSRSRTPASPTCATSCRAGTVRPLDVAQTEAEAAATRASLLDARNRRPPPGGPGVPDRPPALPNPLADDFAPAAGAAAGALQTQAPRTGRTSWRPTPWSPPPTRACTAAIAEYFPSLSVDFTYFLSRQSFPPDSRWLFSVSAQLPIFSGGRIHADVRTAYSLVRQAHQYQSLTRRQVAEQVEVAYDDLQASGLPRSRNIRTRSRPPARPSAWPTTPTTPARHEPRTPDRPGPPPAAELQLAAEQLNQKILYFQLVAADGPAGRRDRRRNRQGCPFDWPQRRRGLAVRINRRDRRDRREKSGKTNELKKLQNKQLL